MGKCSVCGKKILYNKYKMYRGKVLCQECYNTRLERKAAAIAERKRKAEEIKIVTPKKKSKRAMKKYGVEGKIPKLYGGDSNDDTEKAADSSE